MYIKPAIQLAGLAVGGLAYSAATMATMFTTAEFLKKRKIARQKRKAEARRRNSRPSKKVEPG